MPAIWTEKATISVVRDGEVVLLCATADRDEPRKSIHGHESENFRLSPDDAAWLARELNKAAGRA